MEVSGYTWDSAQLSVTVIRLLEVKLALTQFKSFVDSSFPHHLVQGSNRVNSFVLWSCYFAVRAGSIVNVIWNSLTHSSCLLARAVVASDLESM